MDSIVLHGKLLEAGDDQEGTFVSVAFPAQEEGDDPIEARLPVSRDQARLAAAMLYTRVSVEIRRWRER